MLVGSLSADINTLTNYLVPADVNEKKKRFSYQFFKSITCMSSQDEGVSEITQKCDEAIYTI